jgi:hypothetical protein
LNSYGLIAQSAEGMREFFDTEFDSRFHGAKRSLDERRNLALAHLFEKGQTDHLLLTRRQPDQVLMQQQTKIVTKCFALNSVRFVSVFAGTAGNLVTVGSPQVGNMLSQAVNRAPPCERAAPSHQCSFL